MNIVKYIIFIFNTILIINFSTLKMDFFLNKVHHIKLLRLKNKMFLLVSDLNTSLMIFEHLQQSKMW